jgi:hypothetical protein
MDELVTLADAQGADAAESLIEELLAANLLRPFGSKVGISTSGIRVALLVRAINGGDLEELWRRLGGSEGLPQYALIREGMTRRFLESLNERPGFNRLFICSPWIRLDDRNQRLLLHACARRSRRRPEPELYVMTRPVEGTTREPPPSVRPFEELGAAIFLNRRLHTKLYIREPGREGGPEMAIVGSQNLTRSNYLELGIRVNGDGQLISQLTRYFLDVTIESEEV